MWRVFQSDNYVGGSIKQMGSFIFPNGWVLGSYRKVCIIENPDYYRNKFATGHDKIVMMAVFALIFVFNSAYYLQPTRSERNLLSVLYNRCDINSDGVIEQKEIACLPFDQEFYSRGIESMDLNTDGFVSRKEFESFLLDYGLRPLAELSLPRGDFQRVLEILILHARGVVYREKAIAQLEAISPHLSLKSTRYAKRKK
ncbi:hypothetical protein AAMO2058_000929200 [Amorphochlora amoebiformis]|uniref:EF-hand domain-containing protein n=1 Tax=Amorphochlora amoebiformis TaxID=1561963 RepID=A0A7S0DQL8_9EUKA